MHSFEGSFLYSLDYLVVRFTDFSPTIWIESEQITKGCKFASKGLKPLFYNLFRYVEVVGLGGLEPPTSPLSEKRTLMSIQVYIGFPSVA